MARFTTAAIIEELTGKLEKRSNITMRRKEWKYPDGRVFGYGPKEVFSRETRDYKRSPRTEAEERQHLKWSKACAEASAIEHNPGHPRHAEMIARHAAQLTGKPDAVVGKKIVQFGNFVRSVLVKEGL